MGTNYYAHVGCCEHCGKPDYILHIGKSSCGWTFSFRGYRDGATTYDHKFKYLTIKSEDAWKLFLCQDNTKIFDEYGQEISVGSFWVMVDSKRNEPNNHAQLTINGDPKMGSLSAYYVNQNWVDGHGNSFTDSEFS